MKVSVLITLLLFANFAFSQQRGNYGGGTSSQITGKIDGIILDQNTS
jgi:hypothetical protein